MFFAHLHQDVPCVKLSLHQTGLVKLVCVKFVASRCTKPDLDRYLIVNVYQSSTRLPVSDLRALQHACLDAGDFNCQYVNWDCDSTCEDGECLASWVNSNNFAILYNFRDAVSLHSQVPSRNLRLLVSTELYIRLSDRCILEKFYRSQHLPLLISLQLA